jgi:pimeloyl-ACP methyl ester carboxylesterase
VRVQDHVDDAVALLDAMGMERALVACWSIGVNIGFELAQRHPDRVAGLMAVAGVPAGPSRRWALRGGSRAGSGGRSPPASPAAAGWSARR